MSKAPKFSDTKELANVRILDPEIYIPPGSCDLKAKGGAFASTHRHRIKQGDRSCANVLARDRTRKSQRIGRPESHLTNWGWVYGGGLPVQLSKGLLGT